MSAEVSGDAGNRSWTQVQDPSPPGPLLVPGSLPSPALTGGYPCPTPPREEEIPRQIPDACKTKHPLMPDLEGGLRMGSPQGPEKQIATLLSLRPSTFRDTGSLLVSYLG